MTLRARTVSGRPRRPASEPRAACAGVRPALRRSLRGRLARASAAASSLPGPGERALGTGSGAAGNEVFNSVDGTLTSESTERVFLPHAHTPETEKVTLLRCELTQRVCLFGETRLS